MDKEEIIIKNIEKRKEDIEELQMIINSMESYLKVIEIKKLTKQRDKKWTLV